MQGSMCSPPPRRVNPRIDSTVIEFSPAPGFDVSSCAEEEARRRGSALQVDFARYSTAATLPLGVV
jgi:hypothetical protein